MVKISHGDAALSVLLGEAGVGGGDGALLPADADLVSQARGKTLLLCHAQMGWGDGK